MLRFACGMEIKMNGKIGLLQTLIIAITGGLASVVFSCKLIKNIGKIERALEWMLHSIFFFWFLNLERCFLLKTNTYIELSQDITILVIDIIVIFMLVVFFPLLWNNFVWKYNRIMIYWTSFLWGGLVVLDVLTQYVMYQNVNSAIFHALLPNRIAIVGTILVVILYLIRIHVRKKSDEQIMDRGELFIKWNHYLDSSRQERKDRKMQNVLISIFFVVTMCAYPVFETYVSNVGEFSFSFSNVWYIFLIYLVIVAVLIYLILWIMPQKISEGLTLGLFSLALSSYIQGMFLNKELFLMDGTTRQWSIELLLGNILVWIGVFFCVFGLKKWVKSCWSMINFLSFTLVIMQLVGGSTVFLAGDTKNLETGSAIGNYFCTDGMYEVAKEENIIVFVLDRYDSEYVEQIVEREPEFFKQLKGFTYFNDVVAQFSRTYPSIPYMLTGKTFFDPSYTNRVEYANHAFEECCFWEGLSDRDYNMYFYEDDTRNIGQSVKDMSSNYVETGKCISEKVSFWGCIKAIHTINQYRLMPYVIKNYYSYTAESINSLVVKERIWEQPKYEMDDAIFYEDMKKSGLVVNEDEKAFRFIHLYGAHPPYLLNEDGGREIYETLDPIPQSIGSMRIVYEYLENLKKLGLYESSTIVITADHGENFDDGKPLKENTNIILFIKPRGVGLEQELRYSDVYASQNDILPTLSSIVDMPVEDELGMNLFSENIDNSTRERYHYFSVVEGTVQSAIRVYKINGSSLDFENWTATDEYKEFLY